MIKIILYGIVIITIIIKNWRHNIIISKGIVIFPSIYFCKQIIMTFNTKRIFKPIIPKLGVFLVSDVIYVACWYLWWQPRQIVNDENVQNAKNTALAIQALAMNYVRAKKGKCNLKARQMDYTSPWTSDFKYRCVPGSRSTDRKSVV